MAKQLNFIINTFRMTLGLAVILIISDQVKVIHAELDCTSIRCPPAPDCPNDSYLKGIDTSFDDAANDPFNNIHYERLFDPIPPHDTDTTPSRHKIAATQQHYDIEADENEARYKREAAEMPLEYADGNADDEDADESDDIERCCQQSECTCNECHMVECPRNHVAIELSTGKGTPGQCCSTYKCVPDWECKADAELRANISAKQIYWRNECTRCECIRGKELCFRVCQQQQEDTSCYSRNLRSPMEDGSRWMEDPCTSCWCNRGEPRCQMSVCAPPACKSPVQMPDRCCPVCVETAETTAKTTERPNLTTSTESTESESSSTTTTATSTSIFSTSESTVEPEETTLSTTDNETESFDENETTMTDETVSETTAAASSSDASAEDSTDEPTSSSTEPSTPSTEQTSDALTSESTSVTDSTTEGTSSSQSTETSPSKFFSTETSPTFTSDAPFRVIASSSSTTAPEWPSTSTESTESSSPSSTVQTEGPASSTADFKLSTSAPIAEVQATLLTAVKEQSDLERDWLFIFKVFIAVFGIGAFVTVLVLLKKCVYVHCFNQNPLKNGTSSDRITYTPVSGSEVSSQSSASRIQCMVDVEKLGYGKAN